MKKALIIIIALLSGCAALRAQEVPDGYVWADSLVFTPINEVDSTLAGKSIYSVLPDNVQIDQSGAVRSLMSRKVEGKGINGYRIRIFFDNSRTARGDSESALYRFKSLNPGISAYRTCLLYTSSPARISRSRWATSAPRARPWHCCRASSHISPVRS